MSKNQKRNDGLFDTAIVQKRNVLNELRKNSMSLQELRFFSIYLSKINSRDISTRIVRFPLKDFKRIMDFQTLNLTQLRESFVRLLQQVVSVPNENGRGFSSFQLFKRCKLLQDEFDQWYVEIDAHDDALPLMFDFKNKYFAYQLWNALRLRSSNQIRLYEILKQYETIGNREIAVTELREMLGIAPNEYPRWDRFRDRVLDSCQQALAENTDITFTYEKGKSGKGGKWLTIIFHIQKNKKHVEPLGLEDFIDQIPNIETEVMEGKDDIISQLCQVCNYDFTREDIQSAYIFAKTFVHAKTIKPYFEQTYLKLLEIEKKKKISSRFRYFYQIICNDADKQRKEQQDREKNTGYQASYDIAEYESTSVLDDLNDEPIHAPKLQSPPTSSAN